MNSCINDKWIEKILGVLINGIAVKEKDLKSNKKEKRRKIKRIRKRKNKRRAESK